MEAEAALQGDPFEVAGETWEVPSDLLRAIALTETGMQPVVGIEGHDGRPAAYGLMALRGQRLLDAAELAGLSPELVRTRPLPNVSAAAALLSTWADEADIDRSELAAWGPVVARYGDMADEAAQAEYVWRGVYRVLHDGYALEGTGSRPTASIPRSLSPSRRARTWAPTTARACGVRRPTTTGGTAAPAASAW